MAYGNALLTRFPIRHAEHEAFGQASLGEKGFVCAELETPHGILPVVNLHLDFRSRLRRIEQVETLIQFLVNILLQVKWAQTGINFIIVMNNSNNSNMVVQTLL